MDNPPEDKVTPSLPGKQTSISESGITRKNILVVFAAITGVSGLIVNIMIQASPQDLTSNISEWIRVIGFPLPLWIAQKQTDIVFHWIAFTMITIAVLIGVSGARQESSKKVKSFSVLGFLMVMGLIGFKLQPKGKLFQKATPMTEGTPILNKKIKLKPTELLLNLPDKKPLKNQTMISSPGGKQVMQDVIIQNPKQVIINDLESITPTISTQVKQIKGDVEFPYGL